MAEFFCYVPVDDLGDGHKAVRLLKKAATKAALLEDPTYDPEQTGSRDRGDVTDTGAHLQVTNSKTGDALTAAVCSVP